MTKKPVQERRRASSPYSPWCIFEPLSFRLFNVYHVFSRLLFIPPWLDACYEVSHSVGRHFGFFPLAEPPGPAGCRYPVLLLVIVVSSSPLQLSFRFISVGRPRHKRRPSNVCFALSTRQNSTPKHGTPNTRGFDYGVLTWNLVGMGIIGIGIDIVHTPRIASLVARRTPIKLAARILSPSERREWEALSPSIPSVPLSTAERDLDAIMSEKWFRFLAVRWAVKEAGFKALFPLYKPTWKDFTVSKPPEEGGKPRLTFENCARVKMHVSVSHDGMYTIANVLAEG